MMNQSAGDTSPTANQIAGMADDVEASLGESRFNLERARGKQSFQLSSKAARKAAGKAGKAATKGATKMVSAFKRKLQRDPGASQYQAPGPDLVGAAEEPDAPADDAETNDHEDQELLEAHTPQSPDSRTGFGASEAFEQRRRPDQRTRPSGTACGDAAPTAEKAQKAARPRSVDHREFWDANAFKHCRPLQCRSIWDIPTSRIPEPVPETELEPNITRLPIVADKTLKLPVIATTPGGLDFQPAAAGNFVQRAFHRRHLVVVGIFLSLATVAGVVIVSF